jgi:hypothetical protein
VIDPEELARRKRTNRLLIPVLVIVVGVFTIIGTNRYVESESTNWFRGQTFMLGRTTTIFLDKPKDYVVWTENWANCTVSRNGESLSTNTKVDFDPYVGLWIAATFTAPAAGEYVFSCDCDDPEGLARVTAPSPLGKLVAIRLAGWGFGGLIVLTGLVLGIVGLVTNATQNRPRPPAPPVQMPVYATPPPPHTPPQYPLPQASPPPSPWPQPPPPSHY